MSDVLSLSAAVVGGAALAGVMFGGLWWTLRRLPAARHPALLAVASFFCRLGIVAAGFVVVMAGDWHRGLAALLGFLIGRTILLRLVGPPRPVATASGA